MPICRFYQQGTCKFGDRCKFEHIDQRNHYQTDNYHQYNRNNLYYNNVQHNFPNNYKKNYDQNCSNFQDKTPNNILTPSNGQLFGRPVTNMFSFTSTLQKVKELNNSNTNFASQQPFTTTSGTGFSFTQKLNEARQQTHNFIKPITTNQTQYLTDNMVVNNPVFVSSQVLQKNQQETFSSISTSMVTSSDSSNLMQTHTPLSSLDPNDLEQFKANKFTYRQIPLVAPPLELCKILA